MENPSSFYDSLPSFDKFEGFLSPENYQKLPADWLVFVTDIAGSTKAIERGDYRSVNLVGAATITVCMRLLKGEEFPFVFGGDGASLCVPKDHGPIIEAELAKLRNLSMKNFGLDLRVAKIPVSRIEANGKEVLVGKFSLAANRNIAVFKGGGMVEADRLAKQEYDIYKVSDAETTLEELAGLSCRWKPIPSSKGVILSLMVSAKKDGEVYSEVVQELNAILAGGLNAANPVNIEKSSYKSIWSSIRDEARFQASIFSRAFLMRLLGIVYASAVFKYKMPAVFFDSKAYTASLRQHSDSQKFDDTLRLVIDCTPEEAQKIELFLGKLSSTGKISYGIHKAKEALMTCYLEGTAQGEHIHFIDGGDGGYAMAAKKMKAAALSGAVESA